MEGEISDVSQGNEKEENYIGIGVYQGQAVKGDVSANIAIVESVMERCRFLKMDLVLFPELFLTGYDVKMDELHAICVSTESDVIKEIGDLANRFSCGIAMGYPEVDGDHFFNSCAVFDATGKLILNYRKTHLWDPERVHEKLIFEAGNELPVCDFSIPRLDNTTIRLGVLICFDVEFPEPARVLALNGAKLLLVPTALAVSGTDGVELAPTVMVPAKAIENNFFVAYSNLVGPCDLVFSPSKPAPMFCGQSGIFGPDGSELARADRSSNILITARLQPDNFRDYIRRNDYLAERRPELYGIICAPKPDVANSSIFESCVMQ